jgi:hypothetical protein
VCAGLQRSVAMAADADFVSLELSHTEVGHESVASVTELHQQGQHVDYGLARLLDGSQLSMEATYQA